MVAKKYAGNAVIKRDAIAALLADAKAAPKMADTKVDLTVREAVAKMWPAIAALSVKEYSHKAIAQWLRDHGVNASSATLREAIGKEARKRAGVRPQSSAPSGQKIARKAASKPATAVAAKAAASSSPVPPQKSLPTPAATPTKSAPQSGVLPDYDSPAYDEDA